MWSHYYNVTSISQALQLLDQYRERARLIAGGTDLLIELERKLRPGVDTLIDISRIPTLDQILDDGDHLHLGALVTHNQAVVSPLIQQYALPLALAAWEVGAPQIRNRATIAGNLITGSPANDTITPLIALGAQLTLSSLSGERVIPLSEFYTGVRRTVMRPDEMLTAIRFPKMRHDQRGVFLKLGLRRAQAISVVNVVALLTFADQRVTDAILTLGSVAPTIIRVPPAEQALIGQTLTAEIIQNAAQIASHVPTPINDVRSTAEYRTEMIRVLVTRALRIVSENTAHTRLPEDPAMLWGHDRQIHPIAYESVQPIETTVNGRPLQLHTGHDKTLLNFLRDEVGLKGTKEGCAEGECGACTVFLDGAAVMACMIPAPRAHGAEIITIEGLAQGDQLHPIQSAFIQQGAVQCGYCTPGFLMSGAKLLEEHPQPTTEQIRQSISGNLCRCTGYYKIVQAFIEASQKRMSHEEYAGD
ncbi:MAG: FAD binding domain-containing protein [Anaerolineae bacterium]|jgi:carbon-monoxide dehydrogenase medium subunit|nr:FAD binding domain-containing protein [Anaerolineae bacterium]